jgi:hypothetical protein
VLVLAVVHVGGHGVVDPAAPLQVHEAVEKLEAGGLQVGEHGLHMLQLVLHVLLTLFPSEFGRFLKERKIKLNDIKYLKSAKIKLFYHFRANRFLSINIFATHCGGGV